MRVPKTIHHINSKAHRGIQLQIERIHLIVVQIQRYIFFPRLEVVFPRMNTSRITICFSFYPECH